MLGEKYARYREETEMISPIRKKLTYSNAIAGLALFVALSGVAVAAGLAKNSVGPKQLKKGAVTAKKIRREAVGNRKLAPGAVSASKLANGAVTAGKLANGAVHSGALANSAVINSKIANGVVGTNKLGTEVVTTAKLAKEDVTTEKLKNGSVTSAKLGSDVGPFAGGNLHSGQTLRGVVYASGSDESGGGKTIASTAVSFPFPLAAAPALNIVDPNTATTAACPGITGAGGQTPQAAAGNLCVYITGKENASTPTFPASASNRLGFAIETKSAGAAGSFWVVGQWAVTAP
jgi:hypothetical protein